MQISTQINAMSMTQQLDIKKNDAINGTDNVPSFLQEPASLSQSNIYFQFEAFSYSFEPKEPPKLTLSDIGYTGKSFSDLTQDDAKGLVADDGFFGVSQTSNRLSDFVLTGAGDNVEMLKAGREGIIQGFKEAEKIWGDTLPEISYKSLELALEKIDTRLQGLGANVIDFGA